MVRGTHLNADNWPLVAVHAALTPDGRVLTFGSDSGGTATGFFIYDVWDPAAGLAGGHVTLDNLTQTDIFCGTAVTLPDGGDILIAGGAKWTGTAATDLANNKSTILDRGNDSLSVGADMNRARWYASALPLMNGEIYVQGGKRGEDLPEIRGSNGSYRLLTNAPTSSVHFFYPRNFIAPDGRVFGFDVNGLMYYVTTEGNGSLTTAGQIESALVGRPSTAVMYRPGKILLVSGRTNRAATIDIDGPTPVIAPTSSFSSRRMWGTATVLPDGKVLMTGGSGQPDQLVDVTNSAEIWDPDTGQWSVGASGRRPRLYHSIALLLPDATVLVGGGGASNDSPLNNFNAEIYKPPYLFNAAGGLATRPVIASAPSLLEPGETFSVTLDSAGADRVTLVNTGSSTHGLNLQQRFVELGFSANGNALSVDMPARATDTPPGYYLLFVLNGEGVPSRARIVRVGIAAESRLTTLSRPRSRRVSRSRKCRAIRDWSGTPLRTMSESPGMPYIARPMGPSVPEIIRVQATTWTDIHGGGGDALHVRHQGLRRSRQPECGFNQEVDHRLPDPYQADELQPATGGE